MHKIIVRRSTSGLLIGASIGLAGMVIAFIHANYHINGIVFISFIVFASAVVQLLITAPRVIIDEEGISVLLLGKRKFLWKEIRSAELKYVPRGDDVITLILHDNTQHRFMLGAATLSSQRVYDEIKANIIENGSGVTNQPEAESEDDDDFDLAP